MIGIIIINYNTYEKTIDCIESFRNTLNEDYKIYLLDNDSPNNSYTFLKEKYGKDKDIELIKSDENLGYARGNNLCLERAFKDNCETAIISNNDIIVGENTVKEITNLVSDEGGYFITGPEIIGLDGKVQISAKINKPTFWKYIKYETLFNRFTKKRNSNLDINLVDKKELVDVYWISGAFFAVNIKKFKEIGFFDSHTFLYFEEYILSEKARKNSLKISYLPCVKVIHAHGLSTKSLKICELYTENFKSESYFLSNYFGWKKSKIKFVFFLRYVDFMVASRHDKKAYKIFRKNGKEILKKVI